MTKNKRKFADKTRDKILKSAASLFAKQGFSATSMQSIADKAKLNQTLLYHHFGDKKALWQMSKSYLLEHITSAEMTIDLDNGLEGVIEQIIEQRFRIYGDKKVARMMLWQQLEPKQDDLLGGHGSAPSAWIDAFIHLQKKGEMRRDIDPLQVMCWIASSVTAIVLGDGVYFHGDSNKQKKYIELIKKEFVLMMSSRGER